VLPKKWLLIDVALSLAFFAVLAWAFVGRARKAPERSGAPERIVCIAPSVTETVFAVGGGSKIVGVDDYSDWPEQAKSIPKVGGFINPNFERILALKPQLVIVQGLGEKMSAFCEENGIALLRIDMNTLEGVFRGIREVAAAIGATQGAKALEERIRADLKETAEKVKGCKRRRVFFLVGRRQGTLTQLMTAGRGSFLHGLIEAAGGENVFGDLEDAYPAISKESLIKRAPEIIIEAHPGERMTQEQTKKIADEWRVLAMLPAVRDGRVVVLTDDFVLKPGPRIAQSVRRLAEVIHPEVFGAERDQR